MGGKSGKMGSIRMGVYTGMGRRQNRWIPIQVEDWRPITLLSCSYKLISGIVAARLEKFLPKIIGRSQKGFMRRKNINSCTINIMDRIAGAWESGQVMGVLCVDFVKAFDSVEHEFIKNALVFFNFGDYMVRLVMTIPY